ncbi:unnamed protein product [Mesocestoides corti]|uniref:Conserved plasma membrane protein n=1 Tax=Mesocestoides corti TaxID=53468 RepID=A0A0R3U5V4_MESCO|nr:unnamed protein product [Mesocestoides corti]
MVSTGTLLALLGGCLASLVPLHCAMLVLGIAALYALVLCLSYEAARGQSQAETLSLSPTPVEAPYCASVTDKYGHSLDVYVSGTSEYAIVDVEIGESEVEEEEEAVNEEEAANKEEEEAVNEVEESDTDAETESAMDFKVVTNALGVMDSDDDDSTPRDYERVVGGLL